MANAAADSGGRAGGRALPVSESDKANYHPLYLLLQMRDLPPAARPDRPPFPPKFPRVSYRLQLVIQSVYCPRTSSLISIFWSGWPRHFLLLTI